MAKRKSPAAETAEQVPENSPPPVETAVSLPPAASPAAAAAETQPPAAVPAPEKGEGRAYTIDNRLGYRKEDSSDGRKRQIRFANREGGQRPDDEVLAPVREQKPLVSWSAKEKAWQARNTPDALDALDAADQKLAELGRDRVEKGRKQSEGQGR